MKRFENMTKAQRAAIEGIVPPEGCREAYGIRHPELGNVLCTVYERLEP